jgi:hypothetical protein
VIAYKPVDDGKHQDGVVFAEVLISHNGAENGRDIAEELEEHVETSGASVSETKASRSIASVGPVVDVVLEKSLASVVFDGCQQGPSHW